jgi:metal-sulfur cluster biosynthetic enzyme
MAALTEEQVKEALSTVNDPEIGFNIVDLGLVYDIDIDEATNDVRVDMTLTTPGCPLGDTIGAAVEMALKRIGANKVEVNLVWTPPWNPDMMSEELKAQLGWGIR